MNDCDLINSIKNNDVQRLYFYEDKKFFKPGYLNEKQKTFDFCKIAVVHGSYDAFLFLIYGVLHNLNIRTIGINPLFIAVRYKQLKFVKFLLEIKINPNREILENRDLLYMACEDRFRDYEIVKLLIEYGIDINKKNIHLGLKPINSLCSSTNGEDLSRYFELFLKNNADLENKDTQPSIHTACAFENIQAVKFLIKQGVDLDKILFHVSHGETENVMNPVSIACKKGNLELLELLVNGGASVKILTCQQLPHVIRACINDDLEILKYLIFKGAEKDCFYKGFNPLHYCARNNSYNCAEFLLKSHKIVREINTLDIYQKRTPLFYAVFFNFKPMIKLLIKKGSDVNIDTNDFLESVCFLEAMSRGDEEVIKILIKNGAVERGALRKINYMDWYSRYSFIGKKSFILARREFLRPWSFENHQFFPHNIKDMIFTIFLIELRSRKNKEHYLPVEIWVDILRGRTVKYLQEM